MDGVPFDFFAEGKPLQIGWTAKGSTNGWLVLDRNHNGKIDNAKEMFGNITDQPPSKNPNGFAALGVFDLPENGGNHDGVISAADKIWSQLRVWIDANHDGVSQAEEMVTLDNIGIKEIDLGYSLSQSADSYGNRFRFKGTLRPKDQADPVDRTVYDVFLVLGFTGPSH